jgi:hypothetical protein
MDLGLDEAQKFLTEAKTMAADARWQPKKNQDNRHPVLFFEARLRIGQTMPRGLKLRTSVFPTHPMTATFQMECDRPRSRTCLPLYRLEWNPISGHGNGNDPQLKELRGRVFLIGETHEHICTDNLIVHEARIQANGVRAARPVEQEFASYDDAFRYVCGKLNILNPEAAPPSNAQGHLV